MNAITSFVVLVALTIGIVEVIKRAAKLDKRYVPLTGLVVGFLLTIIGSITAITPLAILTGIAVGLSSCGLFDQKLLIGK